MSRLKLIGILLVTVALGLAGCQAAKNENESVSIKAPQSPLLVMLERKVGLIAYVGTDGNVYTVNQSGSNPKKITTDAKKGETNFRVYAFPVWSPDSKSLAFYGVEGASETDITASVYTSDPEGKKVVEVFTSDRYVPAYYLSWSPDSSKVTFIAGVSGGSTFVLNLVPAAGGEPQVLDVGAPYFWDWLPDSTGVVAHSGGASSGGFSSAERLAMLTLGEGVVEDALAVEPAPFQSPELSPDGSKLLLAIKDDVGKNTLVVADRLGNTQNVIATLEGSAAFAWSPDGKRVAYIAGKGSDDLAIGKVTIAELGDELKTVEIEQEDVIAFFWSPDSKRLAYFVLDQLEPPTPEPGSTETAGEAQFYLKLYVADASSGSGTYITPLAPTTQFFRMIAFFDQFSRSTTLWSPDSQNLVLVSYGAEGIPGVYVAPASGRTDLRFLQEGVIAFWSAK